MRSSLLLVAVTLAVWSPARAEPLRGLRVARLNPAEGTSPRQCLPKGGTTTLALVNGEPGTCDPPCRSGFFCRQGQCTSLCNPPCPAGQRCVKGDCEPIAAAGEPSRYNYFGILGGGSPGISGGAQSTGTVQLEFGGKYVSLQIGPGFGKELTTLRTTILGQVPFQPVSRLPFFLVPTISLGYGFGWLRDTLETRYQDFFITPGLRLRYDVHPRIALMLDAVSLQITFVRLRSDRNTDVKREEGVPIFWNLAFGVAFLY